MTGPAAWFYMCSSIPAKTSPSERSSTTFPLIITSTNQAGLSLPISETKRPYTELKYPFSTLPSDSVLRNVKNLAQSCSQPQFLMPPPIFQPSHPLMIGHLWKCLRYKTRKFLFFTSAESLWIPQKPLLLDCDFQPFNSAALVPRVLDLAWTTSYSSNTISTATHASASWPWTNFLPNFPIKLLRQGQPQPYHCPHQKIHNHFSHPTKSNIMVNKWNSTGPKSFSCFLNYSFSDSVLTGFIPLSSLPHLNIKIPSESLLLLHCLPWQPHQILALPLTSSVILSKLINLFKFSFLNYDPLCKWESSSIFRPPYLTATPTCIFHNHFKFNINSPPLPKATTLIAVLSAVPAASSLAPKHNSIWTASLNFFLAPYFQSAGLLQRGHAV